MTCAKASFLCLDTRPPVPRAWQTPSGEDAKTKVNRRDLVFRSPELESRLRPVCEQVLERFQPPNARLLCFLDDEDQPEMTQQIGPLYCGVFSIVKGNPLRFPSYLTDLLVDFSTLPAQHRYDQLVYLRDTTCQTVPATVITLSHELTHCRQRNAATKVWWANSLLYWKLYELDPVVHSTAKPWDIPIEHEAQLNSRRIAVDLLGEDVTNAHAAGRIQDNHDPDKWRFFQSLSTSSTYNLLEATKPWVDRYRVGLQSLHQDIEPEHRIDFTQPEWWR
jgi:hypothetical protein